MNELTLNLQENELAIVQRILQKIVPKHTVWAFGSRVGGNAKPYSDLDLAIIGEQRLSIAILAELSEAFSESDLAWKVDIVDWATLSDNFKQIIQQKYIVIQ